MSDIGSLAIRWGRRAHVWRQLFFPAALTHRLCYRNGAVASPECYPLTEPKGRRARGGHRCQERAGLGGDIAVE